MHKIGGSAISTADPAALARLRLVCSCATRNGQFISRHPAFRVVTTRSASRRLRCECMYDMNSVIEESGKQVVNRIVCCPFCAGAAHVIWQGLRPPSYGVKCRNCGASIPTSRATAREAISAWNRRAGLATRGGKATKGIRSRRKLAAARRNLKKARQVRQLNRLRAEVEVAYAKLQPYRAAERAELEVSYAKDMAWFKEREQLIMAHPVLRDMYELLLPKSSADKPP